MNYDSGIKESGVIEQRVGVMTKFSV